MHSIGEPSSEPKVSDSAENEDASDETALATSEESSGWLARRGMSLIRFYQTSISPLTPPSCRFTPSCSQYTLEAIEKYGFFKGSWLGAKRISRCHPFHPGGHDPVP